MEKALSEAYFELDNDAGAYNRPYLLYKQVKPRHPELKLKDVNKWLAKQDAYSLYKLPQKKFPHNRIIVSGVMVQYQLDLMDMHQIKQFNKKTQYLLTCIDVFSKFAWAIPVQTKQATDVAAAFAIILRDGIPKKVQTDKGREFTGAPFQRLLQENNIKYFTVTNPDVKCSIVERFNRTLRMRIARYLEKNDTNRYIDALPRIVRAYNHSYHSSIKCSPSDVTKANELDVWMELYGVQEKTVSLKYKFNVGDHIRLAKGKGTFGRGYVQQWNPEVFVIVGCKVQDVPTYTVTALDGEEIHGFFYEAEMQLVEKP